MAVPSKLLQKLARRLFAAASEQNQFIAALTQPQPQPSAVLWSRPRPLQLPWSVLPPLPWQPAWVDRLEPGSQPGQHPLHDTGHIYCLDVSSVFAASVVAAIAEPLATVLDLCAAPGGKSLYAWLALQPQQLFCNEVIRKRGRILIANLKRCGAKDALVFNLDPEAFAQHLPQTMDLVLVDAPCSGQSLLAKGGKALGCFHPVTVNKNANRQKRILANAAQTVAPGGYLAYMTCTYSPEENEQVCHWLQQRFPQFQPLPVPHLQPYQSPLSEQPCYRLWPQSGLGTGAFTALFRNTDAGAAFPLAQQFIDRHGRVLR